MYEEELARDFDIKRKKPWSILVSFLTELNINYDLLEGRIIDLGCGNGRNFELFKSKYLIGIDNSLEFLKIAKKRELENKIKPQFILSDMKSLPLRPNSINTIFSIAALHHIKKNQDRQILINQLHVILKKNGFLLITVWRRYQKRFKNHFIYDYLRRKCSSRFRKYQEKQGLVDFGDILIPWKVSCTNNTYERYYHLYSKAEFKSLFSVFKKLERQKLGGPNKKDNFFALFKNVIRNHDKQL